MKALKLSIKKNDSEIEVKDDNTEDSTRNITWIELKMDFVSV